ncbi:MAG: ATP-binding cassette domain-containing protein [Deltaproteobacteria bacterium]
MITVSGVAKSFGARTLFEDVTLFIGPGEKIGLIGPNGAGKSTFFGLLLAEAEPSAGSIQIQKNTAIGYLPQESRFASGRSVLGELLEGDDRIRRLREEKRALELAHRADEPRYGDVLHELEVLDFFELEHKAEKILMGLGFEEADFERPIAQMSGGWQMRVLLAKLLLLPYDLLLLDEPTNYLDLNAALWLKDFLKGYRGTFIMISHDKAYLTEVTNYSLILEHGRMTKLRGSYEDYDRLREEQRRVLEKRLGAQTKKRRQLEDFCARFHAQPNKASAVRNKRKTIERMEEIVLPPDPRESIRHFSFPRTRPSGQRVITLERMCKAYGERKVYQDLDFTIERGDKAVLAGVNGAGKSTLLKILAGVLPFDSGVRDVGHNVEIGYFSQTRLDTLHPESTVLQEAYSAAPGIMAQEDIRTILGAFLFQGDDVEKKVAVLSGGEKSRLNLAKFLIRPPNFLLLDEPTTHLDVDAVDALIMALQRYEGTCVFISHDIHFVRSMANVVYEVKAGRVRKFYGDFDYYLEKRDEARPSARPPLHKAPEEKEVSQEQAARQRAREEQKKEREAERQRKAHNLRLGAMIQKLEKELEQLDLEANAKARALSDPRTYADEKKARVYGRRLKEIEARRSEAAAEIARFKEQLL